MTSLFANFTQGQATLAFRDVINHCESRRGSSGYTIENQTLKLKREISSRHFDVTELALRARLQERFPKGTRNFRRTIAVRLDRVSKCLSKSSHLDRSVEVSYLRSPRG
jgi:hypothetical protein